MSVQGVGCSEVFGGRIFIAERPWRRASVCHRREVGLERVSRREGCSAEENVLWNDLTKECAETILELRPNI